MAKKVESDEFIMDQIELKWIYYCLELLSKI